jgi:mannose/fructose/N-acetylgalactosamine-specific phosphotransferase system component IIB/mannose/fructose-specific phosphotransferase system component IIA
MSEQQSSTQVGIIVVAHADYGSAMLRTAEFILGTLSDCTSISVDIAQEVPETVRRLDDAAQRLDKGAGVIILTDMFGGTPTNLALSLLGSHNVEVVTGVNLPMLLKVSRKAPGRAGQAGRRGRNQGHRRGRQHAAFPEQRKNRRLIRMLWFRVDNRLVHGQVIEGWLPYVAARHLIVANDAMSADLLQQQIVSLAVPEQVAIHFVPVDALLETLACCGESSLVLFADCQDARRALESGVDIRALNIGNLHYAPGKIQVFPHVALSEQDREDLRAMLQQQVELDFRCVPSDKIRDAYEQLL